MNRRDFLGGGARALAGAALLPGLTGAAPRKPNIVVILADDLGYAGIGVQGCADIPTPHIDSIAAAGIRCTDGYVTCPVCAPTRAGLLTGRYQQRFGFEHNPGPEAAAAANFGLPREEPTLAERLRAAGYATGMVGKWHVGYREGLRPSERGFDEFFGFLSGATNYLPGRARSDRILRGTKPVQEREYLTTAFGREAEAFIDRHATHPFFLYLAFNAVHSPLEATDAYRDRVADISDPKRRTHAAMLVAMDDAVGRTLEALRRHKLERDTLVIFLSDNGGPTPQTTSSNAPLRGYKGQVTEGGIRVPFLLRWTGRLPAGRVYREPIASLNIVPTALAAAGAPASGEKRLDGVNLLPFLAGGRGGAPHEQLTWRFGEQAAIRKGDWKLLRARGGPWELYNLREDIGEKKNLASSEGRRVRELEGAWNAWNAQLKPPAWRREGGRAGAARGGVEERFRMLDRNGDGRITADEAPNARLLNRLDANRDGAVTLEEAAAGMRRPRR